MCCTVTNFVFTNSTPHQLNWVNKLVIKLQKMNINRQIKLQLIPNKHVIDDLMTENNKVDGRFAEMAKKNKKTWQVLI